MNDDEHTEIVKAIVALHKVLGNAHDRIDHLQDHVKWLNITTIIAILCMLIIPFAINILFK
jgi:hypothetical protein